MMKNVRNIYVLIVSVLVVFLTMGTYISKMQCDKEFSFYLGKEVPNCKTEKKISCNISLFFCFALGICSLGSPVIASKFVIDYFATFVSI